MTIKISTINQTTDTFGTWLAKTNQAIVAVNAYAVTVNSNTAIGNAAVSGKFTADTLVGNTWLYVGYGTSNVTVNAVSLTVQSSSTSNTIITSSGMLASNGANITSYTQSLMKLGNTSIRGANVTADNLYLSTYANVGNTFLSRTTVYADNMNTHVFYATANATFGDREANTYIDRYGVIVYSKPLGTYVVNTNITSVSVSTVDVYANNLHGNLLAPPGKPIEFNSNSTFHGTNNYFDFGLTSNGNVEIYGPVLHFSHSWNYKTTPYQSSNNIFMFQGLNGGANFTRNIFQQLNGQDWITQGSGERLNLNNGTLTYSTFNNGTINSAAPTPITPLTVNTNITNISSTNVNFGSTTIVSTPTIYGQRLVFDGQSAADIVFTNDKDPDYGLTNYTIRMDNGAFRFAFSSAATRLDYGTEQATIDYAGNIAAQANVSAGRNVYATKDVLAGNSMYSVHDIGAGGTISAAGDVIAYQTSDITYKTNIVNIPNALEKLNQINGIEFDWSDEYISSKGGEDGYFIRKHDVGVIAQEIEAVLPEVVATRGDGTKAVRYEKIIALLIEAVKDLSSQVNELKKKN